MPVSDLHRDIAAIALRAAARHGFALAGGNALLAHEYVVRPTEDVDLFTNVESGVQAAADAVESALRRAGFATLRQDKTAGELDRLTDAQFAQYGLNPDDVAGIRAAFTGWPR